MLEAVVTTGRSTRVHVGSLKNSREREERNATAQGDLIQSRALK
jgi:hypothetical protein